MEYIIIDDWNNLNSPDVVLNNDGYTAVFDDLTHANKEASDCQNGIVLPLSSNLMKLLEDLSVIINNTKFDYGSNLNNTAVKNRIDEILNI